MKIFKRCLCLVLVVFMIIPAFTSGAAVITPYDPEANGLDYGHPAMEVEPYVNDLRILWTVSGFEYMFERLPIYAYLSCGSTWSGLHGRYSIRMHDTYSVDITDAVYSGNSLTFDYTASIDLAPDKEGKTTYHGLFVLFYKTVDDAKEYYDKRSGKFGGIVDGYQIVKYVAPGTVDGQALMESGENITVELPSNFDPSKHVVGYAVWRIEDKDIVYEYEDPDTKDFQYIADPSTESSRIMLFDFSEYITEPEVTTTVTEKPEPEVTTIVTEKPEPDPEPIMGDVDESGVLNLLDVSLLLKYIADWPVEMNTDLADVNNSGRIGLGDASVMLKIIAGWDVTSIY